MVFLSLPFSHIARHFERLWTTVPRAKPLIDSASSPDSFSFFWRQPMCFCSDVSWECFLSCPLLPSQLFMASVLHSAHPSLWHRFLFSLPPPHSPYSDTVSKADFQWKVAPKSFLHSAGGCFFPRCPQARDTQIASFMLTDSLAHDRTRIRVACWLSSILQQGLFLKPSLMGWGRRCSKQHIRVDSGVSRLSHSP